MDGFTCHLEPIPRRYPAAARVAVVAHLPRKQDRVDHRFSSWNFSFILSGEGDFAVDDRQSRIGTPCVITQKPGHHYRYGPDPGATWEELYLIYRADQGEALHRLGLMEDGRDWWRVGRSGLLHPLLRELRSLIAEDAPRHVDRIDRLCERLVVESLLASTREVPVGPEAAVAAIRHRVEMDPLAEQDFDALARAHALSPTHFRRLWNATVGCPPARYHSELRLRRAGRELVETTRPIAAIAA
jgi:AraC-like DNA-binding protein